VGASGADVPIILRDVLGLNIKLVSGYPSTAAVFLAMERGEVSGRTVDLSTLRTFRPQWLVPGGGMRMLLQFGRASRHADFPDVPTARELAATPAARSGSRQPGCRLMPGDFGKLIGGWPVFLR
jgi:hypothetical protein